MHQVESYRVACEENQNTSRALKRENERHKTQLKDLSQQVQVTNSFIKLWNRQIIDAKHVS